MATAKKQIAKPVSVSCREPVYIDGKIKYWQVRVVFDGDLRLSPPVNLSYEDIKMLHNLHINERFNSEELSLKVKLPQMFHICSFEYDDKSGNTSVLYSFRSDLLGIGAQRAWCFRLKILDKIQANQSQNVK